MKEQEPKDVKTAHKEKSVPISPKKRPEVLKKPHKKDAKKLLMKKLDRLVRDIVFERDGGCVTCPSWRMINPNWRGSNVLTPGHFITRGAKSVRWDLRNVYVQCRACNLIHEYHPEVLSMYVRNLLGEKEFEILVFDGGKPKPSIGVPELEELYDKLVNNR